MNALSNAVRFTPHAASEAISVTVRVDAPRQLVIEVADRGPGLRGQALEELKAEFGGGSGGDGVAWQPLGAIRSSGMGIPICVRLAELMGGSVALADRGDGPGARFTLTLPMRAHVSAPAEHALVAALRKSSARVAPLQPQPECSAVVAAIRATPEPAEPGNSVAGTRVLVVDDSPANLRFAAYALRRLGCVVEACADGDEVVAAVAAAAAASSPFDVCVMDFYMARMNGDAALAALRSAGFSLPVVLCTGNATAADAGRFAAMGFSAMLGKPFLGVQLQAAIADALAHAGQASA
jgi:CheY-like chemotaxis protein